MAGQRKFTLIPQHPGRSGDSSDGPPARPMTSKQVQKAYKAANRAPRLSRAELMRQEKAEQERIRKEFEKEKAAAKARAAREKKKGKELAEREEKRKKGLPTVSVRPSQDTISWFVRGNGTAKKRDCEGRGLSAEPVTPCLARGSKLVNIAEEEEEEENQTEDERNHAEEEGNQAVKEEEEDPTEDEEAQNEAKVEVEAVPEQDLVDLDEDFEDDLALELLQDVEASVKKAFTMNPEPNHQHDSPALPRTTTPVIPPHQIPMTRYEQDLGLQRPARIEPPRPESPPAEPTRHSPSPSPSPSPPRQAPPMSTQAILFNFDDYFPSPSQQARELEEEIAEEHAPSAPEPAQARQEPPQPPPPEPEPSLPSPRVNSPSPPPRRFFTSSGSHELMSLALHRSRRTAAIEQLQQRERERVQAGIAVRQAEARARRDKVLAAAAAKKQSKPAPRPVQFEERRPQTKPPPVAKPVIKQTWKPEKGVDRQTPMHQPQTKPPKGANKENMEPPVDKAQVPSASQESEYGGDWVDEIALELMI